MNEGRASRIFIRGSLSVDKSNNGDVMGTFKTSQLLADIFKKGYNEMLVIESRLAKPTLLMLYTVLFFVILPAIACNRLSGF